ncbi:MAG TPA: aminotransferase class I/II-fold pyridoxal phosphate-dependent enzyme [Actinobacteria bacterium]|nr:aminotransferase class I/II-fold pyridoxal phosphate-dependent enzyme [Actinomycetota bacterium]
MRRNPILAELGTYPIATIQARARARREAGLPLVDFSIGDPREPTPPFIRAALRDAVPEVSQYPVAAGLPEFRRAVAGYLERRFGIRVDPDTQILPTSGSKEAIFTTPFALAGAGVGVAYPTPGYPVYERGARFAGARPLPIVLDGDFVLRADDVPDEVWSQAAILWTCSPHNPSGSVATLGELAALYERARDHEVLVCADECYVDVYDEDAYPDGPPSMLQVAGGSASGLLVYLSLSKRSGMTGYRSGAIVGDPEAIEALRALRSTTGTIPPEFTQAAAIAAWSDDAHVAARRAIFSEKRRILRGAFERLGMEIVASRAGLYLWVAVDDDLAVTDRLLDHGIVVSPGRFFGPGGEGYLRLALVPTVEECRAAADALVDALGG